MCAAAGAAGNPDNDAPGVTSSVALAGAGAVEELAVSLRIAHTWVGDLRVVLTQAESGTAVVLLDRPGEPALPVGCAGDDVDCTLADAAALAAEDACADEPPAISGPLRPTAPLDAFAGEALAGTWRLTVADLGPRDTGTLQAWCLASVAALRPTPARTATPTTGTQTATPTRTATRSATAAATTTRTVAVPSPATATPTGATPAGSPTATRTPSRSATALPSATPTNPPGNQVDLAAGGRVTTAVGAVIDVLPGSGEGVVTLSATASGMPGATDARGIVVSRDYDIVASGLAAAQLSGPLLTLPIDRSLVSGPFDPFAFLAETFDADLGAWVGIDGLPRFDPAANSVTFQAPHLSQFRVRYVGPGADAPFEYEATSPQGHFLIKYYCPTMTICLLPRSTSSLATAFVPPADADWLAVGSGTASDPDVPDYIEDLARGLEDGLTSLLALRTSTGAALFAPPTYPLEVRVTYTPDASGDSPLGGPMRIRARLDDWAEMRTTAPHELVHVLTDQHYTTGGAVLNRWYFEAIANLWAARAAGLTRAQEVAYFTREMATYLRVPLTQSDEGSYYAAADFLAWVEGKLGAPIAVDVVAADYTRDIAGLAAVISGAHGTTLDALFFEYGRLATVGGYDVQPGNLYEFAKDQFVQTLTPDQRGWRHEFTQFNHSVRALRLRSTIATPGMLVAVAERTQSEQQRALTTFSYARTSVAPLADIDDYLEKTAAAGQPVVVKDFGASSGPGVSATILDQIVVTGEHYRPVDEGAHAFDFYFLEAPLATTPSMGRIDWAFDGSGIPSPGFLQTPYVAGFNVYSRGEQLNGELIDPAERRYDDARLVSGCGARVTVEDRFGNEWPDPARLALAAPSGVTLCCGQGAACRLAACATGGAIPHQWTIVSGELPPGFAFDSTTGEVSGTVGTAEREFSYRLEVRDAAGATAVFDGLIQHCGDFQGFLCTFLCLL